MPPLDLSNVHIGPPDAEPLDWRMEADDENDEDEDDLKACPPDIATMLGFDPFDEEAAKDEWNEADHPRGQPENAGEFARAPGHIASTKSGIEKKAPPLDSNLFSVSAASRSEPRKLRTIKWGGATGTAYTQTPIVFRETPYVQGEGWHFGIDDDGTAWISGSSMPQDRNAIRALQYYLSPLADNVFIRTAWNKDDYNHLKAGTHRGSINHATGEAEQGLSVAKSPEIPQRYAYFLTGKQVGTGSDGEPILDVATAKPIGRLLPYEKLDAQFEDAQEQKRIALGLSKQQLKALQTTFVVLTPKKYQERIDENKLTVIDTV